MRPPEHPYPTEDGYDDVIEQQIAALNDLIDEANSPEALRERERAFQQEGLKYLAQQTAARESAA